MLKSLLCAFLVLSCITTALGGQVPHTHHHSTSAYQLLFGGYSGQVAPYTFTPPDKLQSNGPVLTSVGESPSWASFSPRHPIAYISEEIRSNIYAVRLDTSADGQTNLTVIDTTSVGERSMPIHTTVIGNLLYVANYRAGSATVVPLNHDGRFDSSKPQSVFQFHRQPIDSIGPVPSRQNHSQAHQVLPDPYRRWVYIPDLGADKIHRLSVPQSGHSRDVVLIGSTDIPAGNGPRHIDFFKTKHGHVHAYVTYELTTMVAAFHVSDVDGALTPIGKPQSALPVGVDPGGNVTFGHVRTTSEVAVSPDGRFVYVGTREDQVEDHISIFVRNQHDGSIKFREWVPAGGRNLRHFSFSPDPEALYIAAGNRDTHNVTILARDPHTGGLAKTPATAQDVGEVTFAGFVRAK